MCRADACVAPAVGFQQEVRSTVDEMDRQDRPQRRKVLRATDVIPPFDKDSRPSEDGLEIPSYDLAENILAEQRRAAARRRRGPGTTPAGSSGGCETRFAGRRIRAPKRDESCLGSVPDGTSCATVALSGAADLLELQRVVAEIVTRDIERLCRKPDQPAYVRLS
jgi:hypothetical protein